MKTSNKYMDLQTSKKLITEKSLTYVEWVDSEISMEWEYVTDVSYNLMNCVTVGVYLCEDKDLVSFASNITKGKCDNRQVSNITHIPKCAIVKIDKIKDLDI